jgi:hypothetical protein
MDVYAERSLLVQGERQLGAYEVQIARRTDSGWSPTVPPLRAVVTTERLILWPQVRRPYPPASLPRNFILSLAELDLGKRRGLMVSLKSGHRLYFYVGMSTGRRMSDALRTMIAPPLRGRFFSPKLSTTELFRLIHFVEKI